MFPYFQVRGATKSSSSSTATFILRNRPTTHIKTGCGLDGDRRGRGEKKEGEREGGRAKMLRKKEERGNHSDGAAVAVAVFFGLRRRMDV